MSEAKQCCLCGSAEHDSKDCGMREGFEAWFADYHNKACNEYGGLDCTNPKGIAEDAWQAARALLAKGV